MVVPMICSRVGNTLSPKCQSTVRPPAATSEAKKETGKKAEGRCREYGGGGAGGRAETENTQNRLKG